MPITGQKKQRSSKLFQCSGYGDCKMVFTRGEHLARHTRKHTGEKPFRCIVPECNKSFSRFDNMMQHTQTHRRDSLPPQQAPTQRRSSQHKTHIDNGNKVILRQPSADINDTTVAVTTAPASTSTTTSTTTSSTTSITACTTTSTATTSTYSPINTYLPLPRLGSLSPVSLSSVFITDSSCCSSVSSSSDEDDEDGYESTFYDQQHQSLDDANQKKSNEQQWCQQDYSYHRRLSVADLCNPFDQPPSTTMALDQLTRDEVEVIQAFGKLRQATC